MVQRIQNNRIKKLEGQQGKPIMDHRGIERELVNFYQDLISYSCPGGSHAIEKVTRNIPPLITVEQNANLLRPIF